MQPSETPPRPAPDEGLFRSRYPEASASAIIFGVVFGAIMNAAITYSGLKIGFTISGTAIAAVVGFGVLRGVLRRGSILEVNIGQTVGSAVNIVNSGIIFTVPVLFLLGQRMSFRDASFWEITVACIAGAILGVVFIVPLRKQMLDIERLRFPTATAVGAILKSPGAGAAKSVVLAAGVAVGALIYAPAGLPLLGLPGYAALNLRLPAERDPALVAAHAPGSHLSERVDRDRDGRPDLIVTNTTIDIGRLLHLPDAMILAFAIAPFAFGAGYLTGRPGLTVLAGGVLAYLVLNPLAWALGWMPATVRPFQAPAYGLDAFDRPLGIGLLLGGALMGVASALPSIREALKSISRAGRGRDGGTGPRDEMSLRSLALMAVAGVALLLVVAEFMAGGGTGGWLHDLNPWLARAIIVAVSVAWIWFAGIIIAQCTGMTDWSPISGMALVTIALVLMLAGTDAVTSAVMIGAALCVAITCAADMMADLKTGYLVGAQPRRQQAIQLAVSTLGPLITMATLMLIVDANLKLTGHPIGPGTPTAAPQAQALQAVVVGIQGGEMPYALYGLGALLGVLLGFGSFASLGVLIGLSMYLPFIYILTYGLGGITNLLVGRLKGRVWAESWGVPFCAGLIVGEAMLALVINSLVLIRG